MDSQQPSSRLLQLAEALDSPSVLPRWGVWLLSAVAGVALALSFSQWRKLTNIQERLAQQSSQAQQMAQESRNFASLAQDLARDAASRTQLHEARLNEYTLQRSHLEQIAFDISRNRDSNLLVDMESSLRLAQQQAQLTGLAGPLVAALRTARQRLERNEQPRLLPVQMAIDSDLQRLTSTVVTDTAGLLVRIDRLLLQLDQLPLRNSVGLASAPALPAHGDIHPATQTDMPAEKTGNAATPPLSPLETVEINAGASGSTLGNADPQIDATARDPSAAPQQTSEDTSTTENFLRSITSKAWQGIRDETRLLFRVQEISHPDAILLTTDQSFFLRQNLRLQLMNARMALLARQNDSARSDMAQVQSAITKYFDLDAASTRQALQILRQLQEHVQAVQLPAITETLAAIEIASSNSQSSQPVPAPFNNPAGNATGELLQPSQPAIAPLSPDNNLGTGAAPVTNTEGSATPDSRQTS